MRHAEATARLAELLGVHPAVSDEAALRAHVAVCAECQARLAALERIELQLRRFDGEEPSASLDELVLAIPAADAASAPAPVNARFRVWRRRTWIPAAAAGLLAVVVATFALTVGHVGSSSPTFVAEHTIAMTSPNSRMTVKLAMGKAAGSNQPVRLEASGMSSTDAPFYTLWVMDDQHHAMSAATFRPEDDGTCVVMGVVPRNVAWKEAAITRADTPPTDTTMLAYGRF